MVRGSTGGASQGSGADRSGDRFSHALLTAAVGKPDDELRSGHGRLIKGAQPEMPPHANLRFMHALVQDALSEYDHHVLARC